MSAAECGALFPDPCRHERRSPDKCLSPNSRGQSCGFPCAEHAALTVAPRPAVSAATSDFTENLASGHPTAKATERRAWQRYARSLRYRHWRQNKFDASRNSPKLASERTARTRYQTGLLCSHCLSAAERAMSVRQTSQRSSNVPASFNHPKSFAGMKTIQRCWLQQLFHK